MALTDTEQAELDRLLVQKTAPEPRTDTGLAGILHALIDSASGVVAHRGDEVWASLHSQAEALAAPAAPVAPAAGGDEGAGFAG